MRARATGRLALLLLISASCTRKAPPPPDTSLAALARTPELDLPSSTQASAPRPEADEPAKIVVTRKNVSVALDAYPIADVPQDARLGLSVDVKWEGRSSFYITPLAQALGGTDVAKRCPWIPPSRAEDVESKICPVLIVADAKTPYRVLTELVFTAQVSRFSNIALAVDVGGVPSSVEISGAAPPCGAAPRSAGRCGRAGAGEPTAIAIEKEGFAIWLHGTPVAPGCKTNRKGITVPLASGRLDFAGLGACVRTIRATRKAATYETVAWLGAEPSVTLADVVLAMDAIRGAPGEEAMFKDVALLLPRDDVRPQP